MIDFKTGLLICGTATLMACGSQETQTPEVPDVPAANGAPTAPAKPSFSFSMKELDGYSYDISKYSGVSAGEPMDKAIENIKEYLKPEGEGNMSVTWETKDVGQGLKTFSGLATNMADDSIKDQEIKIVAKKDDGEYWVIGHGGRVKCWRGDDQDKWTIELCP